MTQEKKKLSVAEMVFMLALIVVYFISLRKIIKYCKYNPCPVERGVASNPVATTDTASLDRPHGGDAGQGLEPSVAVMPEEKYDDDPRLVATERVVKVRLVSVRYYDVTNYNRWSDKKPGYYREYANDDLTELPKSERVLNEWHYTVALDYDEDDYHRALIKLPDGQWTHKYRFHVPGYNPGNRVEENEPSIDYSGLLSFFNGKYFSVPRDRFQQDGRLDVLFTGYRSHVEWHATDWGKRFLPVEIWEIYEEH